MVLPLPVYSPESGLAGAWSEKGLVLLGPVILHFGRKVDSLCSLPTPSAFVLSGHEFKKDVPELTLSCWNQGVWGIL